MKLLLCIVCAVWSAGCACHRQSKAPLPQAAYHIPLLSPGTQFASLPPAVQRTIRAETGGAAIHDVWKREDGADRLVYVVWFENHWLLPPLYVGSDGSVLNPDLSVALGAPNEPVAVATGGAAGGLTLGDLPPAVVKTIQLQAPNAEVARIRERRLGKELTYEVDFKGAAHPPLYVGPDGTVLATPR